MTRLITLCVLVFLMFGLIACALLIFWGDPLRVFHASRQDLVDFGVFFGGVVGPLAASVTLIVLVYTLLCQSEQLEIISDHRMQEQQVAMLKEYQGELKHMREHQLSPQVRFEDVLSGVVPLTDEIRIIFSAKLRRYVEVLGYYSGAVIVYKSNYPMAVFFDGRAYAQYGIRVLEDVLPFADCLDAMGKVALEFIRLDLTRSPEDK
ncbi:hypothetical protein AB9P32_004941 [Pseudomonas aeruginosa]|uniref:hypothetical protein n=1 Tax=Pseudomonas aeruginosa group TaxID=136841 RepID=UPI000B0977EE|nr:hypothetical protein [Pseudomonas aeruginosa]EKU7664169.1 hypothetical protein [Pseudomonas aeruginosa]EKW8672537.1 hypothetical protein [Pseudomonas aeruginosa]ELK4728310.1 hypothetical protein [Pseudomonas aeruginosa]ELK4733132.1 hypothetical protein [Pseudomonas aeruginosa]ELK4885344.1 hypothetical protein [Pseudomonas aeruginosa]